MAKNRRISVRLSNKLSGMLRAAVADMAAVEKDPRYRLNMNAWHRPKRGRCEVCMAGAVLAMRSTATEGQTIDAFDNGDESCAPATPRTLQKMRAINEMRSGQMTWALVELDEDYRQLSEHQHAALISAGDTIRESYSDRLERSTPEAYSKAADILEGAGL